MYDNILISSFGSNIYSTIGFLEGMKDELSSTVIWNVVGNASLIIFLNPDDLQSWSNKILVTLISLYMIKNTVGILLYMLQHLINRMY